MKINTLSFERTMPVQNEAQITLQDELDTILLADPNKALLEQKQHCFGNTDKSYFPVSSKDRIMDMMKAGLMLYKKNHSNTVVYAREATRKKKYLDFATHIVAMSSPDLVFGDLELDKEFQILIAMKNSAHNRTCLHFELILQRPYGAGLMLNVDLTSHKIKHSRRKINPDSQNILEIVQEKIADEVLPFIIAAKTTELTEGEQKILARRMLENRLIALDRHNPKNKDAFEKELQKIVCHESKLLLTSHSTSDTGNTLWEVANRIQENLGLNYKKPTDKHGNEFRIKYKKWSEKQDGARYLRETTLKCVNSINEVIRLNKSLFAEMEIMLKEKESKLASA